MIKLEKAVEIKALSFLFGVIVMQQENQHVLALR